MTDRILEFR